jgi:LCP family protein required for cell wall assembly
MRSGDEGALLPISEDWPQPEKDPDRTNILLLGLRGAGDDNGGLLTDTIILLSVKKSTNQVAMISIPRDLYVVMPQAPGQKNILKEKINFAYALGEERKAGGGLVYSKAVVSRVTNLYIDYAISADFTAFREIVDILGGIDVTLEAPFSEKAQFAKEFIVDLPAGENHLDGETALFFVRSRYSTSDFDRARRQQQVLMAIKNKALSLGILLNPVKVIELLNSLGRHVKTDMQLGEINDFISIAGKINSENIRRTVFDNAPEGLLYASTTEKGAYILLPVGDNFEKIQAACKNIFN